MTTYIKTFSLATDTMTQQINQKGLSVAQYNQGDVNTDTLNLTVTHNNTVMDLTNATVSVVFSKPDGKVVYQDTTNGVTITNAVQGQLSIALNTQTRAAAGTVIGAVRITYSGNQTLETEKFSFNVEASLASDQAIASNNDIQALQALIKFKSFTATANQTLFDISDIGSYTLGQNRLFIDVGGAPQSPNNYTETSTTSFTLSEAVPAGTIVNCRWFQGGGAYLGGHNTTHEIGGGDVIDVTKLQNYNEQIATPISNINAQLAEKAYYFNSVSDMKASTNIKNGDAVITLGYYSPNDGGSASYQIVSSGTADGSFVITLNNGLFAQLILIGSEVKAEQLGFKKDATFDCGAFLTTLMTHSTPNVTIKFGIGTYYFSQTCIQVNSNLKLQGKKSSFDNQTNNATIFSPFQAGQNYIIKLGGYSDFHDCTTYNEKQLVGYSLEWIRFSDYNYPLTKPPGSEKYGMLCIEYCACLNLDVGFGGKSRAIYMRNTWEVQIDNLYLRGLQNTDSIIHFDDALNDNASNISAIVIKNIDIESVKSTLMESTSNAKIADITIGHINLESASIQGNSITNFGENDVSTFKACTPYPLLFNIYCGGLHVNEINLQYACQGYSTISGTNYVQYLAKGNTDSNYYFGDVYFTGGSTGYLGLIYNTLGLKGSCYFNTVTVEDYNVSTGNTYSPKYIYSQIDNIVEINKTNCVNLNNNVLLPKTYKGIEIQNILTPFQSTITRKAYQNNVFSPAYYFDSSYNGSTITLQIFSNVTISFHGCSNYIQHIKLNQINNGTTTSTEYTVGTSQSNTWVTTDISVSIANGNQIYFTFSDTYIDCITVTKT